MLENKLLSSQQYGLRANHSTELAALNRIDHLIYDLDNSKITLNIYVDLSIALALSSMRLFETNRRIAELGEKQMI